MGRRSTGIEQPVQQRRHGNECGECAGRKEWGEPTGVASIQRLYEHEHVGFLRHGLRLFECALPDLVKRCELGSAGNRVSDSRDGTVVHQLEFELAYGNGQPAGCGRGWAGDSQPILWIISGWRDGRGASDGDGERENDRNDAEFAGEVDGSAFDGGGRGNDGYGRSAGSGEHEHRSVIDMRGRDDGEGLHRDPRAGALHL